AVVLAARSDPIVQRLALGLALRRVIRGALERRERRAIELEATSMRSLDQLPMARDQVGCARARVRTRDADVVDAREHDHMRDSGLHQDVLVETRERA